MRRSQTPASRPLRTVVFAMSVPKATLDWLRGEFPEIRFAAQDDAAAGDAGSQIAPAAPTDQVVHEAEALITWEVEAETLAAAAHLRWVHAASAGVDHFDLAAIADRAIVLTNSRGVFAPNMAEHVLGMMIAIARRFPRLVQAQAQRAWRDRETHREVAELQGQTLLVVGLGEIGRAVAERASAFGMRVHGVRRRSELGGTPGVAADFDIAALRTAIADADHVVVTLPDTPRTRGLFDRETFAAMKSGAIIYNVGRGPVIETSALIDALASGHLGGAGLDVTDPEPLPADSPLWGMENVLITAHTSGATPRYWERQGNLVGENIRRWQQGAPLRNVVDLDAGY